MSDARARRRTLDVVVVGAGIGGLVTAIALMRKGLAVRVVEQVSAFTDVGASLELGPNAVRLLAEMGLLDELRRVAASPDVVELVRWDDGSVLLRTELGPDSERHFGAPLLDVFRPDLHRVLREALPEQSVDLGSSVVGVREGGDSVDVQVADGRRLRADVVVAADGIRSPLRQQLLGSEAPTFSGTVVYRAVVPHEDIDTVHPAGTNRYWLGPQRHAVAYWIAGGRLLAMNTAVQHAEWSRESWTDRASPDEVLPYFEGWEPALLERIRRAPVHLRGPVFVRRPLDRWSLGRITLLGDAAHAMEPFQAQGAAQACEDAYVLAECLDGIGPPDVVGALRRYEHIRRDRAGELQALSRTAGDRFYLPDGEEQAARDAHYRTLPERDPWGHRQAIWEYDVRTAVQAQPH